MQYLATLDEMESISKVAQQAPSASGSNSNGMLLASTEHETVESSNAASQQDASAKSRPQGPKMGYRSASASLFASSV